MEAVVIAHRQAKTWSDWTALAVLRTMRWGMDLATGYKHDKAVSLGKREPAQATQKYGMTERKYMIRNIFLESVAGVPGMVAGMLRHLRSMRRMQRDNGESGSCWVIDPVLTDGRMDRNSPRGVVQ